jgi:serine/threonine protein kinase
MKAAKAPTQLGPYEVLEPIGGGGMATVYVGRRREPGGAGADAPRIVALKVMKQELALDAQFVDMFRDEARILSRLSHPNIVKTIEADLADGHSYIAMELLLGRPVADVCDDFARRGEHVPHDLAAWICARVADALYYAHELTDDDGTRLDVVHRDANPTNILLTYDGDVKLIDFGLAKASRRRARSAQGIVKGKIPYLSPEQIKQRAVDHRSDLYTLGATLWEMTTGRRLWKRDTDVETLVAIREGAIPDPTALVPGYPEELWAIVWEALLPHSDDRFADAAAMSKDLDGFVGRAVRQAGESEATMPERLAALLEATFPGEAARRKEWLKRTAG